MPYHPKMPNPKDVVRITVIDLPDENEVGEGIYDYRTGANPKSPVFYDVIGLRNQLKKIMPQRVDDLLDRLQNFRKAYINLSTGEISS